MDKKLPASVAKVAPQDSVPAAILSYLIPGLGQIYQGRIGKGVMFMVCLLGMFFTGQALGAMEKPYIGLRCDPAQPGRCVVKEVVPGSPADNAKLNVDDVIVKIEDYLERVTEDFLFDRVRYKGPGNTLVLDVERGTEKLKVSVRLGSQTSWCNNVYFPRTAPRADDPGFVRLLPNFLATPVRDLMQRLHFCGQFWIGVSAWPAMWQHFNMPVPSFGTAPALHDLQREPYVSPYERPPPQGQPEFEQNRYLTEHDKMPDLAWVYTVIAGALNILVIYDAYAGAAFGRDKQPAHA